MEISHSAGSMRRPNRTFDARISKNIAFMKGNTIQSKGSTQPANLRWAPSVLIQMKAATRNGSNRTSMFSTNA